jgi:hypothetical protein
MAQSETFLDLIEQIDARELETRESFGNVWTRDDPSFGTSITQGRQHRNNKRDPRYSAALIETMRLLDRVRSGALPDFWLKEAMSTSDFPILFGDIIDRQTLGFFAEMPQVWRNFIKVGTVRDFRTKQLYSVSGGEGQLPEVREGAPYQASSLTASKVGISVKKYGKRMPFTFESMINDDLGLLTDTPRRFARSSNRTRARYATSLYVGASGPLGTLYTSGNKNIINTTNGAATNNPVLGIDGLQDGLQVLANMKDDDGEPIVIEAVELVVPPALERKALNLLNTVQIIVGADSGTYRQVVDNWMRNRLRLSVDPYVPSVASTNGNTSWFLFASASSDRPALEIDFLRGYEALQLFMRHPDAIRVGGGIVDPMQGSFADDTLDYKVRDIFGGAPIEPRATVASNGSGS